MIISDHFDCVYLPLCVCFSFVRRKQSVKRIGWSRSSGLFSSVSRDYLSLSSCVTVLSLFFLIIFNLWLRTRECDWLTGEKDFCVATRIIGFWSKIIFFYGNQWLRLSKRDSFSLPFTPISFFTENEFACDYNQSNIYHCQSFSIQGFAQIAYFLNAKHLSGKQWHSFASGLTVKTRPLRWNCLKWKKSIVYYIIVLWWISFIFKKKYEFLFFHLLAFFQTSVYLTLRCCLLFRLHVTSKPIKSRNEFE